MHWTRFGMIGFICTLLVACAPQQPASQPAVGQVGQQPNGSGSAPPAVSPPKRVVAAVMFDHSTLRGQLNAVRGGGTTPGSNELEGLVNGGLVLSDAEGRLHPQLADAVPTTENGRWIVHPDGRMETTWKIRPGAVWHDGVPFTAEDVVFTAMVAQDPELPMFRHVAYDFIDAVDAPDPTTVRIRWNRTFIEADSMFNVGGTPYALPMPRHLLEKHFAEDKAGFPQIPFWSVEFVGTGPYQLRSWTAGSHLVLEANDRYILGRPQIDQIEVRFIPDPNAVAANLLAGEVEVVAGRSLGFEQAVAVRERWQEGQVSFSPSGSLKLWPNHVNPNPAVIGDARFRRALLQAIDRQQLMETLVAGLSSVAHTTLTPTEAGFSEIERGIVRYDLDRASAIRTIEELGYTRGPDGIFRDGSNQRLAVEMRVGVVDILQKATFAAADDWRQIGVATEVVPFPPQRQNFEYIATRPGFYTTRGNSGFKGLKSFHSTEAQTPASRYTGRNTGNYINPAMDALIDRYLRTVSWTERMQTAAEIVHHQTEQVIVLNLFYDASPHFIGNRLMHVPNRVGGDGTMTWNVHEWDIKRDG